ncbi:MAG: hypothetical protein KF851_12620 [Pirellulaceae bacterium]|nr:hypothetical protein [Pirellulaceae bacterium]
MATSRLMRWVGACLLICTSIAPVNAQFELEAKWVPDHANTLVLINADQIFGSAIATKENWAATGAGAYERGLSIVPPGVGKVMLASQIDLEYLEPIWTIGVFAKGNTSNAVAKLAEQDGREVEQVGSRDLVALSGDQYVVQLDGSTVGVVTPANRQTLARWLKDGDAGRVRLSEYLSNALAFADKNADVIIAFDLENLISKSAARSRLINFESIRASDVDALADAMSKLQGLTLGITIRDGITGALRIDFADGTSGINLVSKKFILEALANNGVMINDFLDWEITTEGTRAVFSGPMTTSGIRKISSLINQPIRAQFADSPGGQQAQPASMGKSTRQYFDTIDLYFRELDEFLRGPRHTNARAYARWFDKYANKIDGLSVRNVDPQMVEFGANISEGFRDVSQGLFSSDATVVGRQATERGVNSSFFYSDYNYGYRSNSSIRKNIKAQEYSKAAETARGILENMRNQIGSMRRDMTARYEDF